MLTMYMYMCNIYIFVKRLEQLRMINRDFMSPNAILNLCKWSYKNRYIKEYNTIDEVFVQLNDNKNPKNLNNVYHKNHNNLH